MLLLCCPLQLEAQEKTSKYARDVAKWRAEQALSGELEKLVQEAANQFKLHNYQKALDTYNEALKLNPGDTRIIAKINDVKLFMGQSSQTDTEVAPSTDYAALNELLDLGEILGKDSITFFDKPTEVKPSENQQQVVVKVEKIEEEQPIVKSETPKTIASSKVENAVKTELPKDSKIETNTEKAVSNASAATEIKAENPVVTTSKPVETAVKTETKTSTTEKKSTASTTTTTTSSSSKAEPTTTNTVKVAIPNTPLEPHAEEEKRKSLGSVYPEGITEEIIEEGNKIMTKRVVVRQGKGDEYLKVQYNWGGTYYFKNSKSVSDSVWLTEAF